MCDENKTMDQSFISHSDLSVAKVVINTGVSFILVIFALTTTAMNVVVFRRLGYRDTVNVTITGIACWDLVKLTCALGMLLYGPISLVSRPMSVSWEQCNFPQVTFLHLISANIAYVIAGYMSVERCLCVSVPLKVKSILTQKVTIIAIMIISVIMFTSLCPMLLMFKCNKVYSFTYSADIYCYGFTEFYYTHGKLYLKVYQSLNVAYPLVSLIGMVTSTVIISFHLRRARLVRTLSSVNIKKMTIRDKQVIKMLLVTIGMYIFCLTPRLVHFLVAVNVPEYYFLKYYNNQFWLTVYLIFFFDYFNAACHIFIFYLMTSNFRRAFRAIFCRLCRPLRPVRESQIQSSVISEVVTIDLIIG